MKVLLLHASLAYVLAIAECMPLQVASHDAEQPARDMLPLKSLGSSVSLWSDVVVVTCSCCFAEAFAACTAQVVMLLIFPASKSSCCMLGLAVVNCFHTCTVWGTSPL
jgi:hypothetical protein